MAIEKLTANVYNRDKSQASSTMEVLAIVMVNMEEGMWKALEGWGQLEDYGKTIDIGKNDIHTLQQYIILPYVIKKTSDILLFH